MLKTAWQAIRLIWQGADTVALKTRTIVAVIFGILSGVATYLSTYYLSKFVQSVTAADNNGLIWYLWVFIFAAGLLIFSRLIFRYFTEFIGVNISNNLIKQYYKKIFHKGYTWHLNNSVGYLSSMIEKVVARIREWNWKMPFDYLPSLALIVLFLGYTYSVSVYLFVYFIACILGLVMILRLSLIKRMQMNRERAIAERAFKKTFLDFLYNVRSIKKMNLLKFSLSRMDTSAITYEQCNRKTMSYNALQWFLMDFFVRAQFLIPLGYFIIEMIKTGQGIDVIVMLVSVQSQMGDIGKQIMHFMSELGSSKPDFDLLSEHLGERDEVDTRPDKKQWKTISFFDTKFGFIKDNNSFEHAVPNFVINKGDHVAVMGKSGEGKSTFLNLLTRQYPVHSGAIMVDNKDYNDISQNFFDREFTYVSQDIELFDMSLYDNITMGKKVSPKELQKIIDGCCLNDLITRMKGNLHTDIGEKGIKVSGGEKQRINLARGLLLDRDILVLDEITANLDPTTTSKIWRFIFSQYKSKTIIAISHEAELIKHVNKRIFFKNGIASEIIE